MRASIRVHNRRCPESLPGRRPRVRAARELGAHRAPAPDRSQRDQLDAGPQGERAAAVAPAILVPEAIHQRRLRARIQSSTACDGELRLLAHESHIRFELDRACRLGDAIRAQVAAHLRRQRLERRAERRGLRGQHTADGARALATHIGVRRSEGRKDRGQLRYQHALHPDLLCNRYVEQASAATHAHDGELPRIDALLRELGTQCARHFHARDFPDAPGDLHRVAAHTTAERGACRVRRVRIEAHRAAEKALRVDVAEHDQCIGHRRARAAPAVAGRPGRRSRRLRPHAQKAHGVDPPDGTAARSDRLDIHHGQCRPDAHEVAAAAPQCLAILDDGHVERGAAHVATHGIRRTGGPTHGERADHAGRRSGLGQRGGRLASLLDRYRAASGVNQQRRVRQSRGLRSSTTSSSIPPRAAEV